MAVNVELVMNTNVCWYSYHQQGGLPLAGTHYPKVASCDVLDEQLSVIARRKTGDLCISLLLMSDVVLNPKRALDTKVNACSDVP